MHQSTRRRPIIQEDRLCPRSQVYQPSLPNLVEAGTSGILPSVFPAFILILSYFCIAIYRSYFASQWYFKMIKYLKFKQHKCVHLRYQKELVFWSSESLLSGRVMLVQTSVNNTHTLKLTGQRKCRKIRFQEGQQLIPECGQVGLLSIACK